MDIKDLIDKESEIGAVITKLLWKVAGEYGDGYNIGCLLNSVCDELAINSTMQDAIENSMFQYLEESSKRCFVEGSGSEGAMYGYLQIAGDDCYWAYTNAYFEWYSDKPDWWDEMTEKQEG